MIDPDFSAHGSGIAASGILAGVVGTAIVAAGPMTTEFLTTKELAELLRIKERKVYDLAASGALPCSKAMGKLLFPRAAIDAWIAEHSSGHQVVANGDLPNVFLGSHDPLLEWALRESECGIASYFDGSTDGLKRFRNREGLATGLHLYDAASADWNTPIVSQTASDLSAVLVQWATRQRGLIVSADMSNSIHSIADLPGRRVVCRQAQSGAQVLFTHLLNQAGLASTDIELHHPVRTEADAALQVLEGRSDVSFGLQALAVQYGLGFVPVIEERFDLLIDRHCWFEPALQRFLNFCQTNAFQQRAREFVGYDTSAFGTVHFNGS